MGLLFSFQRNRVLNIPKGEVLVRRVLERRGRSDPAGMRGRKTRRVCFGFARGSFIIKKGFFYTG